MDLELSLLTELTSRSTLDDTAHGSRSVEPNKAVIIAPSIITIDVQIKTSRHSSDVCYKHKK